jgi:Flp pilus assembly secretin CpaC
MVKAAISAAVVLTLQALAPEHPRTTDRQLHTLHIVCSDANSKHLTIALNKTAAIELSREANEILVGDTGIVKVTPRTTRRSDIVGISVGRTDVFFYDVAGRQIIALDVLVSDGDEC